MKKRKVWLQKAGILCFWILLWQLLAAGIGQPLLLASPCQAAEKLLLLTGTPEFWKILLCSAGRIVLGQLLAFAAGTGLGILAAFHPLLKEFLQIPLNVLQAIPVACYAVLLLIWYGSGPLTVIITFVIVFPNLYFQAMAGIQDVDLRLVELAEVYHFCGHDRAWYLYRPALRSHIRGAVQTAGANAWKAGVAAEVIGLPAWSIGEQIYLAKVYLNTAELFAWTAALVGTSWLLGRLQIGLLDALFAWKPPIRGNRKGRRTVSPVQGVLQLVGLKKSYGEAALWAGQSVNLTLPAGATCAWMQPSGTGKTTLFRILAGLEQPDCGQIRLGEAEKPQAAVAFEEERFVEALTLEENLQLAGITGECVRRACLELLSEDELAKPLSQYSLGMGRRAEVLRCMLSDASLLLLDEPFNGLDEKTRRRTAEFIKKHQNGRLLLCITHKQEEAALLKAEIIKKNWYFS